MPSSRFDLIPFILNRVVMWRPKSILDIGVGFGKYGVLFREYLDIWDVDKPYDHKGLRLIGVEAFEKYRNPVWDVYDKVYTEDILTILPELSRESFDLLFMGDVIEHLTKEEGVRILSSLNYKRLIIVTPRMVSDQKAVYGNPYEIHKSQWSEEDFPGMGHWEINNQQVLYGEV